MIRISVFVIVLAFLFGWENDDEYVASSFMVADTIITKLQIINDASGLPDTYKAHIYTPVCEDDRCYAIELILYWDLIGNFLKYDTIPGNGLTKLDHIPFTVHDYQKLQEIMADNHSALGLYVKDELVKNTRSSTLDGITGATVQEIKNSVINGAVYSCYTMWHIVHGAVQDTIGLTTARLFSKDLVQKMVNMRDHEVNYFLINHFNTEDFKNYLPEVIRCLESGEGYFVKNAIEKMPAKALVSDLSQEYFTKAFSSMDYFSQVALLKKLEGKRVNKELLLVFQKSLENRNSYRDELIHGIISFNESKK